eukprot:TRINITY_DN8005_c0_g1_i1.p1 TRINITY_DN8005_c0_g1~~TRINITY_DN8005_c0_g1_i1.p1  ORF type:complete len:126 (+),score=41.21 TRINITY_DN8005_c0_g1_i1:182-559(+)
MEQPLTDNDVSILTRDFVSFEHLDSGCIHVSSLGSLLQKQLQRQPSEKEMGVMLGAMAVQEDDMISYQDYMQTAVGQLWEAYWDVQAPEMAKPRRFPVAQARAMAHFSLRAKEMANEADEVEDNF